ncbi:dihydrodipicolinate synthase family protein [Pontibacillus sp. HMF3514]|uniref:dihydrodipicolinate synthase family protein n=1 Tax=Pontibacillus sp. HMF3514 TaxID=2692425 RepID=UPI00132052AA|nr:dihydrodipicolinate synthase family protein [Pontibacillus sp. HMF3514]QHE53024.1 dihydrodipicolinate synthase family protein [Pontibacillus sp. HMF3514]
MLDANVKRFLQEGTVIPAHPLALTKERQLDEERQRALTKYYIESGAGGIAVGVHTTQFEIRDNNINLYKKVLRLAAEEVEYAGLKRPFIKVAGICGATDQALSEAITAKDLGYDLGLLSMGGLQEFSEEEHLDRIKAVASVIPVFGFYLQPSVGGRVFSYNFWREFADIPGVYAIKMAPFNRYQTLDVVRAVCHSNRCDEIALYTGNDDNIVADLLTEYVFSVEGTIVKKRIVGGILGHWAVWTSKAVELFDEIKAARYKTSIPSRLLQVGVEVTDSNTALFDPAHQFKGCISGINEVLRRQGLLQENVCLNPKETLSPGQAAEIDRIYREYPHLIDDEFIKENLNKWLSECRSPMSNHHELQ